MKKQTTFLLRMALVVLLSLLVVDLPESQAQPAAQNNSSGFYGDLAVGVPGENSSRGSVNVLYGTSDRLSAVGNQLWHQDVPGVGGGAEDNDQFGNSLSAGDFNGDGYGDLAIGVPGEAIYRYENWGVVNVVYGSSNGLSPAGSQLLTRADIGGWYGDALESGDLNGDGYDDLAVGVPIYSSYSGAVHVWYGSASGLSDSGDQLWHQGSPGILGDPEYDDRFGGVLAIGDLNGDSYADLAVGVPGEDGYGMDDIGAVNVIYGSASGLSDTGNQFWQKNSPGIDGTAESNNHFGDALASGDLNGDGYSDLAIGVPGDNYGAFLAAGTAYVLYGTASGLSAAGHQIWHQDQPGIEGSIEEGDFFGSPLAIGDLNGDSFGDLAVGVGEEDVDTKDDAGAVNVIYGSASGLSAAGNQIWHRGISGMQGGMSDFDHFGYALDIGDINGDSFEDLAVGVPNDSFGFFKKSAGSVNVIYGSEIGLAIAGNQFWHQDQPGVKDEIENNDGFGFAVAIGNFNGDGVVPERLFLPMLIKLP